MAETLFTAFKTAFTSSGYAAAILPTVQFEAVSLKDLRTANQPILLSSSAPVVGTSSGNPISIGSALVVSLQTAQSGRQFRGRVFLAGMSDATLADARTFNAGMGAAAVSFITGIMGALSSNSMPLGLAQRALAAGTDKAGNVLPPRVANIIPVTNASMTDYRIDTQRRRLGR